MLLEEIHSGFKNLPRRMLLYGTHKIGKSTFANGARNTIFIPTEEGLNNIDCNSFNLCTSYNDCLEAISELYTKKHQYETVAIDTLDSLEPLIFKDVCNEKGISNIEDILYSKGYVFALSRWSEILEGLEGLRNDRNMTIILIAHTRVEKFKNPETESYDRYVPRIHKWASELICDWVDEIFFATYQVNTRKLDEGFNQKRALPIADGNPIIKTKEMPAFIAGNRLNLPDQLNLNWQEYEKHLNREPKIKTTELDTRKLHGSPKL